jgi:hypothetical protein
MDKLVMRWGLGVILASAAIPHLVSAQAAPPPVAPAPVMPAEPTPAPAVEVTPPAEPTSPPAMMAEPAPVVVPPAAPEEPAAAAPAEAPAAPPPTLSGYVETSYHLNISDPKVNVADSKFGMPMRVYDPIGNSFALHAAHLAITHKFSDEILAVIEVDAGRDAVANSGGVYPWNVSPQFAFDVQEAYASYSSSGWTFTAGKFVTYEGIEVIEGPLNPTITRGFLFGYAEPFTHTGFKIHYQPVDEFNIGIGLVNGWDKIADNNTAKTIIARVAVTPSDKFFAALSGSVGGEQDSTSKNPRMSLDLTGSITPSGVFQLWYQANVGAEKVPDLVGGVAKATWYGFGLQPIITSGDFTLGGRLEYFADPKGVRTTYYNGKFFNFTITPGIKLAAPFKMRAEFRADVSKDKIFGKTDDPSKVGVSAAISAEYTF